MTSLTTANNSSECTYNLHVTENMVEEESNFEIFNMATYPSNISIDNDISKNYYTINEYNDIRQLDCVSIFSLNINSLKKHIDEFHSFITILKNKPDIIILSETRNNINEILNLYFPNYIYYFSPPKINKCGGVAILIASHIKHTHISNNQINHDHIENLVIEVKCKESIIVSGIYKHPNVNLKEFSDILCNHLSTLPNSKTAIIAGDFNVNLKNTTNDSNIMNYINKIQSKNFKQIIDEATRITKNSQTLIDHIYVSNNKPIRISRGIFLNQISDHLCTFVNLNTKPLFEDSRPLTRIINNRNISKFENLINAQNFTTILENFNTSESKWEYFINKIQTLFEISFPLVRLSRKKHKNIGRIKKKNY